MPIWTRDKNKQTKGLNDIYSIDWEETLLDLPGSIGRRSLAILSSSHALIPRRPPKVRANKSITGPNAVSSIQEIPLGSPIDQPPGPSKLSKSKSDSNIITSLNTISQETQEAEVRTSQSEQITTTMLSLEIPENSDTTDLDNSYSLSKPYSTTQLYRWIHKEDQNKPCFLDESLLPKTYSPGSVQIFAFSRIEGSTRCKLLQEVQQALTLEILLHKVLFVRINSLAKSRGNKFYTKWLERAGEYTTESYDSYLWRIEVIQYFEDLRDHLGSGDRMKHRPKPHPMRMHSPTRILLPRNQTPFDCLSADLSNDTSPHPTPPELEFIASKHYIKYRTTTLKEELFKVPEFIPGGYFWTWQNIRKNGKIFRIEELEWAPPPPPPPIPQIYEVDIPKDINEGSILPATFIQENEDNLHSFLHEQQITFNSNTSLYPESEQSENELETTMESDEVRHMKEFVGIFEQFYKDIEIKQAIIVHSMIKTHVRDIYPRIPLPPVKPLIHSDPDELAEMARTYWDWNPVQVELLRDWAKRRKEMRELLATREVNTRKGIEALANDYWGRNDSYRKKDVKYSTQYWPPGIETIPMDEPYDNHWEFFWCFFQAKRQIKFRYMESIGMEIDEDGKNYYALDFTMKEVLDEKLKSAGFPQYKQPPPPPNKTRIAVFQLCSLEDKELNLRHISRLIHQAKTFQNVEMIFLPEGFDYIVETKEATANLSETLDSFLITRYKDLAKQYNVWISLGGFHERLEETKEDGSPWISMSHILLNPQGEIVSLYRKIHLFDMQIPDKRVHFKESSFVRPGKEIILSGPTPIGLIGMGLSFDLRFPEFASTMRSMGAQVLTYPSTFTKFTGESHWEALLKARAIENQCFVIAAAQHGTHFKGRSSYGHSMIIDPWGTVLDEAKDGCGAIYAEIDLSHLKKVREEMPIWEHRLQIQNQQFEQQQQQQLPELVEPTLPPTQSLSRASSVDQSKSQSDYLIPESTTSLLEFPFGQVLILNQIVFLESQYSRAFVNRHCVLPGHVLVTSKRVAKRMVDLSAIELSDLFSLVQKVQTIMESIHKVNSSTIAVQDGVDAGQTIQHVHVHILPRKGNDIYTELANHDKGNDIKWREPSEMKEECDQIRLHIRNQFPHLLKPVDNTMNIFKFI